MLVASHLTRSIPATRALALLMAALVAPDVIGQITPIQVTSQPGPGGAQTYSIPIQTLLFFTALSFLPAVILLMTSFTRIVIVLSLLRQALGTQNSPPNQVIIGLALFLTLFVMAPPLEKVYAEAYVPLSEQKIDFNEALNRAGKPMKAFEHDDQRSTSFKNEIQAIQFQLFEQGKGINHFFGQIVRVSTMILQYRLYPFF